jgi:hypothetical protein
MSGLHPNAFTKGFHYLYYYRRQNSKFILAKSESFFEETLPTKRQGVLFGERIFHDFRWLHSSMWNFLNRRNKDQLNQGGMPNLR